MTGMTRKEWFNVRIDHETMALLEAFRMKLERGETSGKGGVVEMTDRWGVTFTSAIRVLLERDARHAQRAKKARQPIEDNERDGEPT